MKVGRRHVRPVQQLFAEYFAAFQLGCRLAGAEDAEPRILESVDDPRESGPSGPTTVSSTRLSFANRISLAKS